METNFKGIFINQDNQQPHVLKEKMIKKLKIDNFFEDDPWIVKHLKNKAKKTKIYFIEKDGQLTMPTLPHTCLKEAAKHNIKKS